MVPDSLRPSPAPSRYPSTPCSPCSPYTPCTLYTVHCTLYTKFTLYTLCPLQLLAWPAEDRHFLLVAQRVRPRRQEGGPLLHRQEPQQPFGENPPLLRFYPTSHGIKFSTESPLCHFGFKIRRRENKEIQSDLSSENLLES